MNHRKVPPNTEDADRLADLKAQQAVDDLKWLLSHAAGRRFVWRLLETTGVYRTSFHSSGSVTAFNEGQRNVGLLLIDEIHEHDPDAFLTMLKECK